MTLDEARGMIGRKVVYRSPLQRATDPGDEGVIVSVNASYVFVRYGTNVTPAATAADCLETIS